MADPLQGILDRLTPEQKERVVARFVAHVRELLEREKRRG